MHEPGQPPRAAHPVIVVGVLPAIGAEVVRTACELAAPLKAELVLAYVDPARYVVDEVSDGLIETAPLDPQLTEDPARFPEPLGRWLGEQLAGLGIPWRSTVLVGEPAEALSALAYTLDATMIVVGTRKPGLRTAVAGLLDGSVVSHLAQHQHRPVLMVPAGADAPGALLWDRSL